MALSIAYELDVCNFLEALLNWGIEPLAEKRSGPLVIAGGILTLINPLPLAPFVDLFLLGDGEILIPKFRRLYRRYRIQGKKRLLEEASKAEGFWAPSLGKPAILTPVLQPRSGPLHSAMLTSEGHFGEMFLIEVGRGCPRGCRFCASCHINHYEFHPLHHIIDTIKRHIEPPISVGLIGSALSDYPYLTELAAYLAGRGYRPSISSLRVDAIDEKLLKYLVAGGMKTLALAPEAGSTRLRRIIGKGLSHHQITEAVRITAGEGVEKLRLYFMIGLPGETGADLEAIANMVEEIAGLGPKGWVEVSVNAFVPKPHTPFQWASFATGTYLKKARAEMRKTLPQVKFTSRSVAQEKIQALLSQGNEKMGLALYRAINDEISLRTALTDMGVSQKEALGEKELSSNLPWECFQSVFDRDYLVKQWGTAERMAKE